MNKIRIIGMLIGLIGMALAWLFFSWKLTLILFLVLYGNNLEQVTGRKK